MKIYNTMSGKKEEFEPLCAGKVKMYVCGLTVYDYMHIGNARTFVVFDAVYRYLVYKGYDVTLVRNYTDIDDRIIKRAVDENISISAVAERYIKEAETDSGGLNALPPAATPRVTQEMPEILDMIQNLVEKNFAYEKNGQIFYNTGSFPEYGKLSKKNTEELNAGARIEINEEKRNPTDFVLWKPSKENEPGWPSPWGLGRPGWHIECSVMAKKYLGDTLDIHAGGEDLIFPHHENEIAQSEAANGCMFSKYWMHVRHLNINNQKMAKSTGNFFTVREIAEKYSYAVIRFFLLSSHYRSTINFSDELMEAAQNAYNRIKNCVINLRYLLKEASETAATAEETARINEARFENDFREAMDDDFNTADAITAIFEFVKFANTTASSDSSKAYISKLLDGILSLCGLLGLELPENETLINDAEIEALIEKRQEARRAKDFKTADEIRDKLLEMGITLEDTRQGVRYSRI